MIGVQFIKAVAPYGAGDKALLPEAAAQAVVDRGEARLCEFPAAPHAAEFGESPANKAMQPKSRETRRQTYKTKGA